MRTVYDMAKEYYPKLWNIDRINALLRAGKLTQEEYDLIVQEVSTDGYPNPGRLG